MKNTHKNYGIVLKNIGKKYEGRANWTLKGIDLEIAPKDFCVILGPSGCGKSTLLRMLAGLNSITEGDLIIGDKKVNAIPPKDRDIAMVFQSYALYPHMTVYDNMGFSLKMRKTNKIEIDKKVRNAAELLQITDYLFNKPGDLSGGQRQRVALGRAIVRNPGVFLMDEPLSNLDAKLREHMRIELVKLHENLGATSVYVTHDQVEAMTMGTKIVLMNEGKIQHAGAPEELYNKPANIFTAKFIGSPTMNITPGKWDGKNFVSESGWKITPSKEDADAIKKSGAKNISLGIRPERFSSGSTENTIEVEVTATELLGRDKTVFCQTKGKEKFIMLVPGHHKYETGEKYKIGFEKEALHFFDTKTTKRIN